jgi:hypothetical protein
MSKKTLAYVIYPGVSLLELVGNRTVLGGIMERKAGYRAVVVGARMEAIATDTPLSIIPVPATYLIRLFWYSRRPSRISMLGA